MPEIIEFYTGRKAILGNIPTWRCSEPSSLKYVLEHLHELVVKEVHGSGGYGMLVGPAATKKECEDFAAKLKARPSNYIAQPTLALSTCPDPDRCRPGTAPRRSAALRAGLRPHPHRSWRADTCRAEGGIAGGQLLAGRRHERYVGSR